MTAGHDNSTDILEDTTMSEEPPSDDTAQDETEHIENVLENARHDDADTDISYDLDDLGNVKEDWEGMTIYLPEDLHNALNLAYRELSLETARTTEYDLQKLQDFYPLLVAVGLNNLDQSDTDDLLSMLEYLQAEYGE
ncbi:hypothetical protein G6M89_16830 [Natronolimnobius sp. AArcel1]|uniref:hypothetical protein n=1 Tax=Natronolimnobius sp. AArcel1 TaxID=1679093 RepID=UPI0013EAFBBD|nr:hypothetical protein [Natronolimnobius sp. AArcel1]NGM70649.1 hypothetical protein [Natronolimnobius sp. AArcel1]